MKPEENITITITVIKTPGTIEDLTESIYRVNKSKNEVQEIIDKSYHVYQQYARKTQKENLVKYVTELVNN